MEIDFNNLRLQIAYAYNGIISAMNEHTDNGNVSIDTSLIENDVENLRTYIHSLLCCYDENDNRVKSLSDEIELEIFNKK